MKTLFWNGLALAVGAALLAGCAGTGEGGGKDMMKSGNTAMDNMKRVMMMPEAERMAYMMKVQQTSLEHGKAMFHDPNLGTNGQTCASCHVGGDTSGGKVEMMPGMKLPIPSLLGVAARFPKYKVGNDAVITLPEMNNNCIVMFQKGKPLPLDSREARDLAAYVSTLK